MLGNRTTGTTEMTILNGGGGTARGVFFVLVAGGKRVIDGVGDGLMQPGTKAHVHTELPWDDNAECVVMWRNADESSWVHDRVGPARRIRRRARSARARRKVKARTIEDMWTICYPAHPLPGLPEAGRKITMSKAGYGESAPRA